MPCVLNLKVMLRLAKSIPSTRPISGTQVHVVAVCAAHACTQANQTAVLDHFCAGCIVNVAAAGYKMVLQLR